MEDYACIRCLRATDDIVSFLQLCSCYSISNGFEIYRKIKMFLDLSEEDRQQVVDMIDCRLEE